jgi:hypothetical protein
MFFLSKNLCVNIVYPDVHAKCLFQIFKHFEICFIIMNSFAPVSQNGYGPYAHTCAPHHT